MASPKYTVLSQTYTGLKAVWTEGKNYKLISTVESLVESSAKTALSVVDRFVLKTGDLNAVDQFVTSTLNTVDDRLSPYVSQAVTVVPPKVSAAVTLAEKVPGVAPCAKLARAVTETAYGIFRKNLEKVGKKLLIQNPETSAN